VAIAVNDIHRPAPRPAGAPMGTGACPPMPLRDRAAAMKGGSGGFSLVPRRPARGRGGEPGGLPALSSGSARP
jgi:hypothetical protein